jgi:glutaminyl-tRNA synthetase
VKGTLHWVSVQHAVSLEVRLYDRLFKVENVSEVEGDFKNSFNTNSLVVETVYAEPALLQANLNERYQFIRKGYFCVDRDSTNDKLVFNRTVGLRDTWAKSGQ